MPYLTPKRHEELLGQVNLNRSTWKQLPRSITGKRSKGPAAAIFEQMKWAHDLLEEMLREHVTPTDMTTPASLRGPRVRPPRAPRKAMARDD